jgi:hypothetical protein
MDCVKKIIDQTFDKLMPTVRAKISFAWGFGEGVSSLKKNTAQNLI